jgi:predicted Zn-dependent peptidase
VRIENAVQSLLAVGFKRPDAFDRDDAALDIVQMILAGGRAAWLQKELVETKRLAAGVQAQSTFPGGRYPHLFTILLAPAGGHTLEENDKELETVLARLRNQKVDEATLERAREQARLAMVRRLGDNAGLAAVLAVFTAQYGDWRKLLTVMDDYRKVTADQVQIVALKHLIPAAKTSVYMTPPPPAAASTRGGLE